MCASLPEAHVRQGRPARSTTPKVAYAKGFCHNLFFTLFPNRGGEGRHLQVAVAPVVGYRAVVRQHLPRRGRPCAVLLAPALRGMEPRLMHGRRPQHDRVTRAASRGPRGGGGAIGEDERMS